MTVFLVFLQRESKKEINLSSRHIDLHTCQMTRGTLIIVEMIVFSVYTLFSEFYTTLNGIYVSPFS
jgi:hypothetical protein